MDLGIRALNRLPAHRPQCPLFCRIRNEAYFLPHLLSHYRALGVDHFYFADDGSDDGSRELLLAQPDCTVLEADFGYGDMIDGLAGKRVLATRIPEGIIGPGWILSVDADEFLVLPPGCGTLQQMIEALETRGEISCSAAMVDFYPKTLKGRFVDRSISPFEAFPYFDTGPYFLWQAGLTDPFLLNAGVRHRLNEWMFAYETRNKPPEVMTAYRPTWLHKVPLMKWGQGMVTQTDHTTNISPYVGTRLALAHFKFYPDLDIKIEDAILRETYYGQSFYYRLLYQYVRLFGDRSLIALVSRKYESPIDLVKAALLFSPDFRD